MAFMTDCKRTAPWRSNPEAWVLVQYSHAQMRVQQIYPTPPTDEVQCQGAENYNQVEKITRSSDYHPKLGAYWSYLQARLNRDTLARSLQSKASPNEKE
jgi:hypothetical protein